MTAFTIEPLELYLVTAEAASRIVPPPAAGNDPSPRDSEDAPVTMADVLRAEEAGGEDAGRRAGTAIRTLVEQGAFREVGRALAVHEIHSGRHHQVGLVGGLPIRHVATGIVRPHEQTRSDREQTLSTFLDAAAMDASPVVLAHRDLPALDELLERIVAGEPDVSFVASADVRHRVWVVSADESQALCEAVSGLDALTVMDGHHRVAAALGRGEHDAQLLTELVSDRWVNILGIDRRVALGARTAGELLGALREMADLAEVTSSDVARPTGADDMLVHVGGHWHVARFHDVPDDPVDRLPPVLLQHRVLGPVLGIADPRTDPRIELLPAAARLADLASATAETHVTFVPRALTMAEVHAVAESQRVLPPKSTWVEPKPGPGVFLHLRW